VGSARRQDTHYSAAAASGSGSSPPGRSQACVLPRNHQPSTTPHSSVLRANPYPEVTDRFCRLPLPTFVYLTRGSSPWRPAADIGYGLGRDLSTHSDFQGPVKAHWTPQSRGALRRLNPYLGVNPFHGPAFLHRRENSPQGFDRFL
jgi:hypothetical protein